MSINHSLLLMMPKGRFIEAIRILEPHWTEQTGLYDPQSVLPKRCQISPCQRNSGVPKRFRT